MREYYGVNIPNDKSFLKKHEEEIAKCSFKGGRNEKKVKEMIARGNKSPLIFVPAFHMKKILGE